jgi:hypothetical protein
MEIYPFVMDLMVERNSWRARSRRLLLTTKMELKAIAPAARIGIRKLIG